MATNLIEIQKKNGTQAKCLQLLKELRWGKTVTCPNCEKSKEQVKQIAYEQ